MARIAMLEGYRAPYGMGEAPGPAPGPGWEWDDAREIWVKNVSLPDQPATYEVTGGIEADGEEDTYGFDPAPDAGSWLPSLPETKDLKWLVYAAAGLGTLFIFGPALAGLLGGKRKSVAGYRRRRRRS